MKAKTAIIVLNWNSREMTAACIRSILAMNSGHYDIIVVDNGSHDGSPDYLRREFPEITILPQERNLGFAAGCNVGMRRALAGAYDYVLLINNDTIVDAGLLEALVDEAQKRSHAAIFSPKIYFYDLPDRFWWAGGTFNLWEGIPQHVGRKQVDSGQYDSARQIHWATGCAAFIRCDALRRTGLFDEEFFGNGEDLDISLRMRRTGYQIWFAPKAKLWHKEGVDYRKNAGEYVRKFTGTRNLLWIMHKHAGILQWISFLPNFLFRYALFYILLSVWRQDYRSAYAVLDGIWGFLRMRVRPGSSPLPNKLSPSPARRPEMLTKKNDSHLLN